MRRDDLIQFITEHGHKTLVTIIKELRAMPDDLDVQALRESAKAHIAAKHAEAEQTVRDGWDQGRNQSMPAFGWGTAQAWLDDWNPL